MEDYGLMDQFTPDMNLMGMPENIARMRQYGMAVNSPCANKNPNVRMRHNDESQRLFPIRTQSVDQRTDIYEKTPICERFDQPRSVGKPQRKDMTVVNNYYIDKPADMAKLSSATKKKSDDMIKLSSENILWLFMFAILIFIAVYFQNTVTEMKKILTKLQMKTTY